MTDAPTTGHCHNENYMKTTHPFVAPVLGSTQSKVNMEAYEQAIDQYNEGNYLGAFYQLLDHLNPAIVLTKRCCTSRMKGISV